MNGMKGLQEAISQDAELFMSEGQKIAYAIDNFHISFENLIQCSTKTELPVVDIIDILMQEEKRGHDIDNAVKNLMGFVEDVVAMNEEDERREYAKNTIRGCYPDYRKKVEESKDKVIIHTGFKVFDKVLDGGLYEGVYLIGAMPSLGKTTFVMQMADCIASQKQDILVFALEMSKFDLMARSISRMTSHEAQREGCPGKWKTMRQVSDIRKYKNFDHEDKKIIALAENKYMEGVGDHLYIFDGVGAIGVRDIRHAVEEHIRITGRVPFIVIDYIQILAPFDVRMTDKQNVDRNTLELMQIVQDFKTVLIGISSFSRTNYNTKVSMASFKESGALEYGADVMVGLQFEGAGSEDFDSTEAKRQTPRKVEAVVLKNRGGVTGETMLYDYYPQINLFLDKGLKDE